MKRKSNPPALHFVESRRKKLTNCGRARVDVKRKTSNYDDFTADSNPCDTCDRSTTAQKKLYERLARVFA